MSARSMSVSDRISNFAQNRKVKKEREMFQNQMQRLYDSDRYTLGDHRRTFDEAIEQGEGWRGMMPGVKKSPEFATIKRGVGIFDAMTSVEDVNELLKQYELLQHIHRWLKLRKQKGFAPPLTTEQLQEQMQSDKDGISANYAAKSIPGTPTKYRRSGKKRRY